MTKEEFFSEYNNFQSLEDFDEYMTRKYKQTKNAHVLWKIFPKAEADEIRKELDVKYKELKIQQYILELKADITNFENHSYYYRDILGAIDYVCENSKCTECRKANNGECLTTTTDENIIYKAVDKFHELLDLIPMNEDTY